MMKNCYELVEINYILNCFMFLTILIESQLLVVQDQEKLMCYTLRKKCPYLELFWSVFSRIWAEYAVKYRPE